MIHFPVHVIVNVFFQCRFKDACGGIVVDGGKNDKSTNENLS